MFSSHSKSQLTAGLKTLGKRSPTIDLKHYALAGAGIARFVARVVQTDDSRQNPKLIADAVREKFNGDLVAVAGSLRVVEKGSITDTITGILAVRRDVISLAAGETPNGFKAVACNMFLDDEDNMWSLNKTANGQMMIRANGIEDDRSLLNLLTAHASASQTSSESREMLAVASAISRSVQGGDFVNFVDNNNEMACGFVVASDVDNPETLMVIRPEAQDAEIVNANAVTEILPVPEEVFHKLSPDEEVDLEVAIARSGGPTDTTLINYYKQLFGNHPEFFNKMVKQIRDYDFG